MPLPQPAAQRTRTHVRGVQLDGYKRSDGCWETAALQTFASDVRDNDDSGHQRPIGSTVATRWSRIRTRFSAITRAGTVARSPGRMVCLRFVTFVPLVTLVTLRNLNSSKESA